MEYIFIGTLLLIGSAWVLLAIRGLNNLMLKLSVSVARITVVQNMMICDFAEHIILDLEAKSKQRELTEDERNLYHKQRQMRNEAEKKLKDAGYIKKSFG